MRRFLFALLTASAVAGSALSVDAAPEQVAVLIASDSVRTASLDPEAAARAVEVHARLDANAAHRRKINIAGRQRMLSQRLASAACLVSLGIDTSRQERILVESMRTYGTTLGILRGGSRALGISPEFAPKALAALDAADAAWAEASRAAALDPARRLTPEDVAAFMPLSDRLLATSRVLVAALAGAGERSPAQTEYARMVDIAGRQRMLSQRATKHLCLMSLPGRSAAARAADSHSIATAIAAFDASARSLSEGNALLRIHGAPSQEARWGLEASAEAWTRLGNTLHHASAGDPLPRETLADAAKGYETLLPVLEDTVWFYVTY